MGLMERIRNGKRIVAAAAVVLAGHSLVFAGGHCHSCCHPCPTLTGEFFGYYPTLWQPWPGTPVPSTPRPSEQTPPARPMPNPPESNEPLPAPVKDKTQDGGKPGPLGIWKQTSPYSPTPLAARHPISR